MQREKSKIIGNLIMGQYSELYKMNKKEIIMLIIFTMFVPFQIGLYILFGISLLANVNLVESEFVLSAIGFTVPAIVGIIFFRKEIIESFTYFKREDNFENSKYSYGSFIYGNCGTVCYAFSSNWSTREPRAAP